MKAKLAQKSIETKGYFQFQTRLEIAKIFSLFFLIAINIIHKKLFDLNWMFD